MAELETKKADLGFPNLYLEVGKAQICVFCQQYASHSSAGMKTAIRDHELNIKHVEGGLNRNPDVSTRPLLQEGRMKLSSILHEKVQGALVRSCVFQLKDMDAPSSFFFNLEI